MRILFAGTADIAVPSLELLASRFELVGLLTAADKAVGRGRKVRFSAIKNSALKLDLKVLQPARLGKEARDEVSALGAQLLVVFAYGKIFGPKFLSVFPYGGINMHPSALPLYRGPSPITAVILAGEKSTALTVQRISPGMDEGDILRRTPLQLTGRETTASLSERVSVLAAEELASVIQAIANGTAHGRPQNHDEATYCKMVKKEDGRIQWTDSATRIEQMIRAYQPWPKAFSSWKGESLAILEARVVDEEIPDSGPGSTLPPGTVVGVDKSQGILIQTGKGILSVMRLQLASRKPLDFRSFLNGVPLQTGSILGE